MTLRIHNVSLIEDFEMLINHGHQNDQRGQKGCRSLNGFQATDKHLKTNTMALPRFYFSLEKIYTKLKGLARKDAVCC